MQGKRVDIDLGVIETRRRPGDRLPREADAPLRREHGHLRLRAARARAPARTGRASSPISCCGCSTAGERVAAYRSDADWFDIGTLGEYERAVAELERRGGSTGDVLAGPPGARDRAHRLQGRVAGAVAAPLGARGDGFSVAPPTTPSLFEAARVGESARACAATCATPRRSRARHAAPEVVFHLAAQAIVRGGARGSGGTFAVNVIGTAHVLDAARDAAVVVRDQRQVLRARARPAPRGRSARRPRSLLLLEGRAGAGGGGLPRVARSARGDRARRQRDRRRRLGARPAAARPRARARVRRADRAAPPRRGAPVAARARPAGRLPGAGRAPRRVGRVGGAWNFGPEARPWAGWWTGCASAGGSTCGSPTGDRVEAPELRLDASAARERLQWRRVMTSRPRSSLPSPGTTRSATGADPRAVTLAQIEEAELSIGIVGLGYVGLPLAVAFAEAGEQVIGVDVDHARVAALARGPLADRGHLGRAAQAVLGSMPVHDPRGRAARGRGDPRLRPDAADPQPRARPRAAAAARAALAGVIRRDQVIVLESTTFPGTTREHLVPLLEESGLRAGEDFALAFSPERVDPGRTDYTMRTTPKVVGGLTAALHGARAPTSTARVCDQRRAGLHARGGRAVQAAREHLPLGQHRARQRAGDARRPHGDRHLGGHRRRRDQAVRLHALRARPRHGRPLPARRPVLPEPGRRASTTSRPSSSSSPARSTSHMPYFCMEKIERALNDAGKPVRGSRILIARRGLQGAASATCASRRR